MLGFLGINLSLGKRSRDEYIWYELGTKDTKKIKTFYEELPLRHPVKTRKIENLLISMGGTFPENLAYRASIL